MIIKSAAKKYFSPEPTTGSRVNNFNIIRFIAAAMVIYGHMAPIMGVPVHVVYGQAVSTLAVKILFVISGYLIMKSLLNDGNFGRYMLRRSFRIFPGLIGVVFFAVFLVGPVMTGLSLDQYFKSPQTWYYLRNILLFPVYALPDVFYNYTYPVAVNGSLWTLPVEFSLYLVLPFLLVVFKKLKIVRPALFLTTVLSIAANCVHMRFFPAARLVVYGTNWPDALSLLPYFFAGSFLALDGMKKFLNLQISLLFMALALIFQISALKYEILMCVILPYFVLSLALAQEPVFSHWFEKADFSYGIYLYGFVIQQLVYHQLEKVHSRIFSLNISFILCFSATFVCAILSWYVIEKPMQRLCKKILSKSPQKSDYFARR